MRDGVPLLLTVGLAYGGTRWQSEGCSLPPTMTDDPIPSAVRALHAERIDAVPELEAVLLLRESRPRAWSAEEAGTRLYVSTIVASHVLATLAERGFFVEEAGAYRYEPESGDLAEAVDQLAVAYRRHLVAVTQIIHSKPSRNVLDFANAFRLRKPR